MVLALILFGFILGVAFVFLAAAFAVAMDKLKENDKDEDKSCETFKIEEKN